MNNKPEEQRIYVGCGTDRREGFVHCDTRALEGVDLVCDAWQLSSRVTNVSEVYSRHMLEHLTSMEAEATLRDWHRALKIGGQIYIVVPNLDFHIQQWLDAEWNEESIKNAKSDARYGFAGLFGWQRECNPKLDDYNQSYWDVHKSGYNKKRLKFLLERAGYTDIQLEIKNDIHLVARAIKSMNSSERQISPDVKGIRLDHQNRYRFAKGELKKAGAKKILDLACGIGYGCKILSELDNVELTGVDVDAGAVTYARQHYHNPNIKFINNDARTFTSTELFDSIVSFETIEHIDFDSQLLKSFYQLLKPDGVFICSTPNQDVIPYDKEKFRYHVKHYTLQEIESLLVSTGFKIMEYYTQVDPVDGDVELGSHGAFSILVCVKK